MRTIRNIILVIIFLAAIAFCLYIATNYQKTGYEDKINLVINYKNVTSKMKGKVILKDGEVYLSTKDIENYYDKNLYLDEKYNYIVAADNSNIACFDINNNSLDINGNVTNDIKIIKEDDLYYVPISKLNSVYNINVSYKDKTNTVLIESLGDECTVADINSATSVRSKATLLSKKLEKIDAGAKVYVCDSDNQSASSSEYSKSGVMGKINGFVSNQENKVAKNWTYIRTENGTLGYIKNSDLVNTRKEREKEKVETKKVSLVWEYFHEKYGKAPKKSQSDYREGFNVVSPTFFFMEGTTVKENVGTAGENYIKWAKSNNCEVWARVANNNESSDIVKNFSEWINDYKKREDVIKQIAAYAKKYDLDGINIDFENMYKSDKDAFSRFIIELKPRLASLNVKLSVDVTEPDGSDNWSLCYDRNTIGRYADYVVFMAYDQNTKGSKKQGSVASLDWVEKNIKKFINNEKVDPNKIIVAIPFYTRLWKVNSDGTTADAYNVAMKDEEKYVKKASHKEWLEYAKQNYIEYDEAGYTYKMWMEDADSIGCNLDLINKYNLAGAAYWQKGNEDDAIWQTIKEKLF